MTWTVEADVGIIGVDVLGDEPIWHNDEVVGWVTSGGYSHFSSQSVAMGYVPAALESEGEGFEIEILGGRRVATPVNGCLWDRSGQRMRA